jgi:hypothetical protein
LENSNPKIQARGSSGSQQRQERERAGEDRTAEAGGRWGPVCFSLQDWTGAAGTEQCARSMFAPVDFCASLFLTKNYENIIYFVGCFLSCLDLGIG